MLKNKKIEKTIEEQTITLMTQMVQHDEMITGHKTKMEKLLATTYLNKKEVKEVENLIRKQNLLLTKQFDFYVQLQQMDCTVLTSILQRKEVQQSGIGKKYEDTKGPCYHIKIANLIYLLEKQKADLSNKGRFIQYHKDRLQREKARKKDREIERTLDEQKKKKEAEERTKSLGIETGWFAYHDKYGNKNPWII